MKNKLPTSQITTPQSQNYLPPAIQDVFTKTKNGLSGFLTEPNRKNLEERNRKIAELIEELEVKVKERSEEIGYGYNLDDYAKRLSVSDEVFKRVLCEKSKIKDIFEKISCLIDNQNSKESFTKRLIKDYLEDLVYESMKKEDYCNVLYKVLDLSEGKFNSYNEQDLKNSKIINLSDNNIGNFEIREIKHICTYFKNAKIIYLGNNDLVNFGTHDIHIMFSHLTKVKHIGLGSNYLHLWNDKSIQIMCHYLKNVKSIALGWTPFSDIQKSLIISLLPNTNIDFGASFSL